jgi:hypothetical protein
VSQVRISSPTAAAAFILIDLLGDSDVTASRQADGTWEVVVALRRTGPTTLPFVLSAARDWLSICALPGTRISVGDRTHTLQRDHSVRTDTAPN